MLLLDFYKVSHRAMYPEGTEVVYSTWTPRASRVNGVDNVVHFGTQAFLIKLMSVFEESFFSRPKSDVIAEYARIIKHTLGVATPETKHIEDLHDLGYLPLLIKGLPEGTVVPLRVPTLTVQNTDPRFFWLTNYIETLASCEMWQASTSATIAREYRRILDKYSMETVGNTDFVQFQGHDFSMRGMSSLESAIISGMGHLTQFSGTDTVPCIQGAELYYGANVEKELVGTSIPATEHSIQCAYGNDTAYLKRMINEVHPSGFVSVVSDGYDYWDVVSRITKELKNDIMARDGRLVIRPDSGDPVKIVCGDPEGKTEAERKGSIEVLWDIFGGAVTEKGYKVLDSHIGLIYGDAITMRRAEEICERLKVKGFASINVVFGIGSYTYQYNTRDTFGYAMKSTLCVVKGEERQIFKNPKTDDGTKKSQKGKVVVYVDPASGGIKFKDGFRLDESLYIRVEIDGKQKNADIDLLQPVFENGKLLNKTTFAQVRARLSESK
jgi:nicotinamide phosphoribosyltransferase